MFPWQPDEIPEDSPLMRDINVRSRAAFPEGYQPKQSAGRSWWKRPRLPLRGGSLALDLYPRGFGLSLESGKNAIEQDVDAERGGRPEHLPIPPQPPTSTGTKYPDLGRIAEMARPEHDTERRAAHARINAAMPKTVSPLAKEVPGTLHYSIGGGPMQSRAPGQGRLADEDFSATQGAGFGQMWKPGGGGYMQSDIESLPWDQKPESWKASHLSPAQMAMSPVGAEREKSRLQEDVEGRRRRDYQASVDYQRAQAQEALASAKTPEEKAKITARLEDQIKTITESFGIGARLTSNALYGGF